MEFFYRRNIIAKICKPKTLEIKGKMWHLIKFWRKIIFNKAVVYT